jgi:hypothetical protein
MEYVKYMKLMAKMNQRTNVPQPPVPQFEKYCKLFIDDDEYDVLMGMKLKFNSEEELRALYHGSDWDKCSVRHVPQGPAGEALPQGRTGVLRPGPHAAGLV